MSLPVQKWPTLLSRWQLGIALWVQYSKEVSADHWIWSQCGGDHALQPQVPDASVYMWWSGCLNSRNWCTDVPVQLSKSPSHHASSAPASRLTWWICPGPIRTWWQTVHLGMPFPAQKLWLHELGGTLVIWGYACPWLPQHADYCRDVMGQICHGIPYQSPCTWFRGKLTLVSIICTVSSCSTCKFVQCPIDLRSLYIEPQWSFVDVIQYIAKWHVHDIHTLGACHLIESMLPSPAATCQWPTQVAVVRLAYCSTCACIHFTFWQMVVITSYCNYTIFANAPHWYSVQFPYLTSFYILTFM